MVNLTVNSLQNAVMKQDLFWFYGNMGTQNSEQKSGDHFLVLLPLFSHLSLTKLDVRPPLRTYMRMHTGEDKHFKKLMLTLKPGYTVPPGETVMHVVSAKYSSAKGEMFQLTTTGLHSNNQRIQSKEDKWFVSLNSFYWCGNS